MELLTATVPLRKHAIQNTYSFSENTTLPNTEFIEGSFYIFLLLGAILATITLTFLVYLMANNRRRLVHMYCKKRPNRRSIHENNEYDSSLKQDLNAFEEKDEVDNEDNPAKSLLTGKLQINNRFENYLSTSQLNRSSVSFT